MKISLMLYLTVIGIGSAFATECRHQCRVEFWDCREEIKTTYKEKLETAGTLAEREALRESRRDGIRNCRRIKWDCYEDCNQSD